MTAARDDSAHWRTIRAEAHRAGDLRTAWHAQAWCDYLAGRRATPPTFAEWDSWFPADRPTGARLLAELRAAGERLSAVFDELRRKRAA